MSPSKLFDYLDGNLSSDEREQLEAQIAADPVLRRELANARKLHQEMHDTPEEPDWEEAVSDPTGSGAKLARRIAIGAIVLVFLNVLLALFFVFKQEKKRQADNETRTDIRQQVEQSVQRAATSALPLPSLESDEIRITVPVSENEAIADKTVAAAATVGGSGSRALTDETGIVVLVDIPKSREQEFRDQMVRLGAQLPAMTGSSSPASPNDRKFLQIRIVKAPANGKS